MAFSFSSLTKGALTLRSLEAFVDAKLKDFAARHGLLAKRPAKKTKKTTKTRAVGGPKGDVGVLLERLNKHPKRQALRRLGAKKDQLVRSLVPLWVAQGSSVRMTSGVISAFWKANGVTYAAPNAAKALRNHPGNARRAGKAGFAITPKGVRHLKGALSAKR